VRGAEPPRGNGPANDLVGRIVSHKYLVLGQLGTGGMGTIYDCENLSLGRRVALKVLNPAYKTRTEAVGRFEREARAAARIGHPNIIDVLDMGHTEDHVPYIVMERLDGEDLFSLLDRSGPLQPALAVDILNQVLSALGAAHAAGIVHRDLKPDNIFLARRGPRADFVKILDFGIAKFNDVVESESKRLTRDGSVLGTPSYMSPEQAAGSREIDPRSDLYTAGVLLYEMLSGSLAYPGENYNEIIASILARDPRPIREVAPWVTEGLAGVVARAMARDRDARFKTAADFTAALEPFADIMELEVPEASARPGRDRQTRRPLLPTVPGVESLPPTPSLRTSPSAGMSSTLRPIATTPAVTPQVSPWAVWIGAIAVAAVAIGTFIASGDGETRAKPHRTEHGARPVVEAPSPSPPRIHVDVSSNAPGARASLDGRPLGTVPVAQTLSADDAVHQLRLEADGYEPVERSIPLDRDLHLVLDLEPSTPPPSVEAAPPPTGHPRGHRPSSHRLIFDDNVYR
jgi:eukaryotic-like serine/threonine-protein kinase